MALAYFYKPWQSLMVCKNKLASTADELKKQIKFSTPMRIFGVTIPDNKRIDIALTYVYGIGRTSSTKILGLAGIPSTKRVKDLSPKEVQKMQGVIEKNYRIEGELRQEIRRNIDRLKELKTYRGIRHIKHLPVRGQRTKTNSRTRHGNIRKTAGSGKRKVELK